MRIDIIDCCPMRPLGVRGLVPSRCLLLELDGRVILVDAGISTADVADPIRRLGRPWVTASRPLLEEASCAIRQVQSRGFVVADVTDIVLSHMDVDHAGGIVDFPSARVHVHARELESARASGAKRPGPQRARYRSHPMKHANLIGHSPDDVTWQGIDGCVEVPHAEGRVLLVPLFGHSVGHCGIAVRTDDGWLLHAADAVFDTPSGQRGPTVLRGFDLFIAANGRAAAEARVLVRELATGVGPDGPIRCVTSHVP